MESKDNIKLELQEHFFDIIDQARNGITITNPNLDDNPLIYVNKAFSDIFGYSFEEAVGKNCRFLQNDDRAQSNLDLIREAIKEEKEVLTILRNYTKTGELIYSEVKISPIFDKQTKKLKYFLGIQKDISEFNYRNKDYTPLKSNSLKKEKLEFDSLVQELNIYQSELLAQNEELIEKDKKIQVINNEFTSLFLDAPIPYLLINEDLQIKKFNYLADGFFNLGSSKIQIKSMFYFVKGENIQKLVSWVSNKDYLKFNLEIYIVCKEGSQRRYKLKASEYALDSSLLMLSLLDIQEEYEIKNNLEQKVLEEVNKRLMQEKFIEKQSKLASMGEMIDVIAHQWLNPLSLIGLYAQNSNFIISTIKSKIEDMQYIQADQEKISEQVEHLVDTLNEFRSFFRPDKESEYVSLKVMIDSVLILMKDELVKNKITADISYENDFNVKVIENQFKHVLINLITNSRDAFIERKIDKPKISFYFAQCEEFFYLEYCDNAGGIPQSVINNIFELNFTTKSEKKGTGIGLYLCRQIIRKFNCEINARNIENGVCFKIRFPK